MRRTLTLAFALAAAVGLMVTPALGSGDGPDSDPLDVLDVERTSSEDNPHGDFPFWKVTYEEVEYTQLSYREPGRISWGFNHAPDTETSDRFWFGISGSGDEIEHEDEVWLDYRTVDDGWEGLYLEFDDSELQRVNGDPIEDL